MNHYAVFLAALGVLAAASGCASKTGSVRGRVTYQGKPVAVGTVTLVRDDGWISKPLALDADGRFTLPAVPIGTVTAVVSVPPANFFTDLQDSNSSDPEAIARAVQAKKCYGTQTRKRRAWSTRSVRARMTSMWCCPRRIEQPCSIEIPCRPAVPEVRCGHLPPELRDRLQAANLSSWRLTETHMQTARIA